MGLCCNKNAFLSKWINRIDFLQVIAIILEFAITLYFLTTNKGVTDKKIDITLEFFKGAKIVRTLRPLRLANARVLRLCMESLASAIPSLTYALLLNFLFIYVFSILGVQLFSGKISGCSDDQIMDKDSCEKANKKWILPNAHFNDI